LNVTEKSSSRPLIDGFRIERLSCAHDRAAFTFGYGYACPLFSRTGDAGCRRRVGNCFVAIDPQGRVAGYCTFAATSLPLNELPEDQARRLPRYAAFPACLVGRLAVDQQFRGHGLGGALIVDAAARAMRAEPTIFALDAPRSGNVLI